MRFAIAIDVFNSIADGKDGTLALDGRDLPTTGYFVGGVAEPLVFDSFEDANRSTALTEIIEFLDRIEGAGFVGWWTDSETGKIYIDATTWHSALGIATWISIRRNEIAFWDIANSREVRVK